MFNDEAKSHAASPSHSQILKFDYGFKQSYHVSNDHLTNLTLLFTQQLNLSNSYEILMLQFGSVDGCLFSHRYVLCFSIAHDLYDHMP